MTDVHDDQRTTALDNTLILATIGLGAAASLAWTGAIFYGLARAVLAAF